MRDEWSVSVSCPILSCARPIPLPSTCYAMIKAVADKKKTNKQTKNNNNNKKLAHSHVFLFVLFLFWFSAVPGWYQVLMSSKL